MGATSRALSCQYDRDDNRIRIAHPDGVSFAYAYDGLDRPFYLHSNWTAGIAFAFYGAAGSLTTSMRA